MDWAVTARTTEPHVRQTVADRELETWVVVDLSPSLDFGTAGVREARPRRRGARRGRPPDRGAAATGSARSSPPGEQIVRIPARGGLAHARGLLRTGRARCPRAPVGTRGDLAAAIEALRRPPRRRGLAVVVSDFLGEPEWERALRALSGRHELLAVEVLDPRELELPDVGHGRAGRPGDRPPARGGRPRRCCAGSSPRPRRAHRDRVAAALRRCGAAHLRLRTDSDWVADVVRFVARPQADVVGRRDG